MIIAVFELVRVDKIILTLALIYLASGVTRVLFQLIVFIILIISSELSDKKFGVAKILSFDPPNF